MTDRQALWQVACWCGRVVGHYAMAGLSAAVVMLVMLLGYKAGWASSSMDEAFWGNTGNVVMAWFIATFSAGAYRPIRKRT